MVSGQETCDIFISYSGIDNEDPPQWVDLFAALLEKKVSKRFGVRISIWKDDQKLQGNDLLDPTILKKVQSARVLVSVLSPGYVRSTWCKTELSTFCESAQLSGGLDVDDKSRIFKVIKLPVDDMAALGTITQIIDCIGYPFYQLVREKYCELDPGAGREAHITFADRVDDVAISLAQTLKKLKGIDSGLPHAGTTIYLATASSDVSGAFDSVRNGLRLAGHTVLQTDASYTPDFRDRVAAQLAKCRLSIHLVGDNFGIIPEGYDAPVDLIQYDCAGDEAERRPEFLRLSWRPTTAMPADSRQAHFIARIRDNPPHLVSSVEDLKSELKDRIAAVLAPPPTTVSMAAVDDRALPASGSIASESSPAHQTVYIVHDPVVDAKPGSESGRRIRAIRKYLFDEGFEVAKPLAEGDEILLRQYHEALLNACDAVLFYHGDTTDAWLQTKLLDLQRARGNGRRRAFDACAAFFADPRRDDKDDYLSRDVPGLEGYGTFAPAMLTPFLSMLRGAATGSP